MSNDSRTALTQAAQLKAVRELERWEKATMYSAQKSDAPTTVQTLPQRLVEGKLPTDSFMLSLDDDMSLGKFYDEFEVLRSGSGGGHHRSRTGGSARIPPDRSEADDESIEGFEDDYDRIGARIRSDYRKVNDEGVTFGRYDESRVYRDNDDPKPEKNESVITKTQFLKTWAALEQDGQRRAWRNTNAMPCRECVTRSRTCWFERDDSITCVPCHKKRKKCSMKDDFGVFRLSSKLAVRRSWVRAMLKEGWHRQHRTVKKVQLKGDALEDKVTRVSTAGHKKRPLFRDLKSSAALAEVSRTQTVSVGISAPPRIAKVAALAVLKRRRLEHEKQEDAVHKENAMVGSDTPDNARTDTLAVGSKWKVEDVGLGEEKEASTIRFPSVQQVAETAGSPAAVDVVTIVSPTHPQDVMTATLHPALDLAASAAAGDSELSTAANTTLNEMSIFASDNPPVKCLCNQNSAAQLPTKTPQQTSPVTQPPAEHCFRTPELQDLPSPHNNSLLSYVSHVELFHEIKPPVLSSVDGVCSSAIGEGLGPYDAPMRSTVEALDNAEPLRGDAIARYLRQFTDLRKANAKLIEEQERLVRSRDSALAEARMVKSQVRGPQNPSGSIYNDIHLQIQQVEAECRRAQLEAKRARELANFWRGRALRVKLELCGGDVALSRHEDDELLARSECRED